MRPLKIGICGLWSFLALALMWHVAAADTLIKRFESGDGRNAVGLVEASEDTRSTGRRRWRRVKTATCTCSIRSMGELYRLIRKPHRRNRAFFPDQIQPTDLVVRKADILVWDGSIHTLQAPAGNDNTSYRGLEEVNTRAADDKSVVSAFAQMGSVDPGSSTDLLDEHTRAVNSTKNLPRPRQFVASRGAGTIVVDVIGGTDRASAEIEVRRQSEAYARRWHERVSACTIVWVQSNSSRSTATAGCLFSPRTFPPPRESRGFCCSVFAVRSAGGHL